MEPDVDIYTGPPEEDAERTDWPLDIYGQTWHLYHSDGASQITETTQHEGEINRFSLPGHVGIEAAEAAVHLWNRAFEAGRRLGRREYACQLRALLDEGR